jgi:hypothetical protein
MVEYCKCDKSEVNTKSTDKIFERCVNCKQVIGRQPNICKYYNERGYCDLAEEMHFTYPCKVNGEFSKCKNGAKEGE